MTGSYGRSGRLTLAVCAVTLALAAAGCGTRTSGPGASTGTMQTMPKSFPSVSDSSTGLVVKNEADVPLERVHVVVDAEVPGQAATMPYSADVGRIGPNDTVTVPYSTLKSGKGVVLNPGKYAPKQYHVKFGDSSAGGTVMGEVFSSTGTGSNAVSDAISQGDVAALKKLLDGDPTLVNKPNFMNEPPLFDAVFNGRLDVVKLMLDHHANVNAHNNLGQTPLDQARFFHHDDIVKLLIAHGAKAGKPFGQR